MTETTSSGAPRNALAVAALALGVTGLVLSPLMVGALLGLAAVVLGMVAWRRGSRRGMAAGGIVTGALAIPVALVVAAIFLIAGTMRQRTRETASLTNLNRLNAALLTYTTDWNSAGPDGLAKLAPYTGDMTRLIRDARTPRRRPGPLPATTNPAELQAVLDQECDFWYAGAGVTGRNGALITLYDRGVPGGRRLVAFGDGRAVIFQSGSPELRAAVVQNNQVRESLHLPPLPLDLDGPPPTGASAGPEP
jgi:hypothetical protein